MEYSVVIPIHDEEGSVVELHRQLTDVFKKMNQPYELIFIDDNSADSSLSLLKKMQQEDSHVKLIRFRRQFGQTAAWAAGFAAATGTFVITMDGDLQNDPADIPAMVEKMKKNEWDVISGWRRDRKDKGWLKLGSRAGNAFHRWVTGEKIHDHGCSLKIYRSEALVDLELYSEVRRYITALLAWKGFRVGEAVVHHRPRQTGVTKYSFKKKIKGFLDLLVVKFWIQYSSRPIHFFGAIGIVLMIAGFVLGGTLGVLWLMRIIGLAGRSTPLLAVLLVLVGVQFLLTGVLADIVARTYYTPRKTYSIKETYGFE